MTERSVTESVVEEAALAWRVTRGLEIAPVAAGDDDTTAVT